MYTAYPIQQGKKVYQKGAERRLWCHLKSQKRVHRTTSTPSTCSASIGETCCVPLGRRQCFLMFFPPESSFAWNKTGKKNPSHHSKNHHPPHPRFFLLVPPKSGFVFFQISPAFSDSARRSWRFKFPRCSCTSNAQAHRPVPTVTVTPRRRFHRPKTWRCHRDEHGWKGRWQRGTCHIALVTM